MTKKKTNYQEELIESLKDSREAVEYLKAALEENDMPEVFLLALRNVAEARGLSSLARDAKLNRENLYKILSKNGNPELSSLYSILDVLGLRLTVEEKDEKKAS